MRRSLLEWPAASLVALATLRATRPTEKSCLRLRVGASVASDVIPRDTQAQPGAPNRPAILDGASDESAFRLRLYFTSPAPLQADSSIEFVLTLPQQITLAGDVHIRCYARVLRVDSVAGRQGVAARIERYEFLPASA